MIELHTASRVICDLREIPDPGGRAFRVGAGLWPLRGFVVRQGEEVYAYVNRCPHAGHPLDGVPDRFLSVDHRFIQCGSHGALFEIRSGLCVAGPCAGRSLRQLKLLVQAGRVVLVEDPEVLAERLG